MCITRPDSRAGQEPWGPSQCRTRHPPTPAPPTRSGRRRSARGRDRGCGASGVSLPVNLLSPKVVLVIAHSSAACSNLASYQASPQRPAAAALPACAAARSAAAAHTQTHPGAPRPPGPYPPLHPATCTATTPPVTAAVCRPGLGRGGGHSRSPCVCRVCVPPPGPSSGLRLKTTFSWWTHHRRNMFPAKGCCGSDFGLCGSAWPTAPAASTHGVHARRQLRAPSPPWRQVPEAGRLRWHGGAWWAARACAKGGSAGRGAWCLCVGGREWR